MGINISQYYSYTKRTSNGFPLVGWNMLPPLPPFHGAFFQVNVLTCCWIERDFARWLSMLAKGLPQNVTKSKMAEARWLLPWQKSMWHGCKQSNNWDNTRNVCCAEQDYFSMSSRGNEGMKSDYSE